MIKKTIIALAVMFLSSFSFAQDSAVDSKKYHIVVTEGLDWLAKNSDRIFSLEVEAVYQMSSGEEKVIPSRFSAPETAEDCEVYDVDNKYSNYFLFVNVETLKPNQAGYSQWYEGQKVDGVKIAKKIVYCFAN